RRRGPRRRLRVSAMRPRSSPAPVTALACALVAGCGGASPLMHTAHPLAVGHVTVGAGFSGSVNVSPPSVSEDRQRESGLRDAGTVLCVASCVGGGDGFGNDFDGGVVYTARSIRADIRHAWLSRFEPESAFHSAALSLSLGASGLLPKRDDDLAT